MTTGTHAPHDPHPDPVDEPATRARSALALPVLPLVVVMLLVVLVVVGAALTSPWELTAPDTRAPTPLPTPVETVSMPPTPPPTEDTSDDTLTSVEVVVAVLTGLVAVAAATYLLLRAVRRRQSTLDRRPPPHQPRSPGHDDSHGTVTVVPELQTAIRTATARLRGATTSTDAVIAAWLALEDAAAASGVARTAAQTPTEYTLAVLDTTPAPPDAVARLLHLYHLARFTSTPLTPQHVTDAQACLTDLARSLEHPNHATGSTDTP